MSIDRSLRLKSALSRHRNVLTRGERILLLKAEERWTESDSVFSLPKVTHRRSYVGKKTAAAKKAAVPVEALPAAEGKAASTE
jgi:small basic protein (TIGR04137 family)